MTTIGDLLARDLNQRIEEIIKVSQTDEQAVYREITEYIATDRIKAYYEELLRAVAESPNSNDENVGVWISGFFGSGKSSFAKNLGYILENSPVCGYPASELFTKQVADDQISNLLTLINRSIPVEVVMFDVNVMLGLKGSEQIAEIMYSEMLRKLDYAQDFAMAELEYELEGEGRLEQFKALCQQKLGRDWNMVRKSISRIGNASMLMHELEPTIYPTPEFWMQSDKATQQKDLNIEQFAERTFDLMARRRSGKALIFIMDEVGQYVARSETKIENLRAVVETFGRIGRNRVKQRKAAAPTWIFITSQEKLEEIVAAIDSKRLELARLQDRFHHRVDLVPSDIREVATKRVLSKKQQSIPILTGLFRSSQGQLNAACRLERTTRKSDISEENFIQFYPYLPHYIELSIDIMSGIRLQPGAGKHLGGSNRTIIKQAYEMLISPRTNLAAQPAGTLVTLDKIYELVEGNIISEKQKDVSDIASRFHNDPDFGNMAARVAKVICLLEFVSDLPRTTVNIAALLVDKVGDPAPLEAVKKVLEKLGVAQFVREGENGWTLQTAQEKKWDEERRKYSPLGRQRNDILREALRELFSETRYRNYHYHNLKTFTVGISVDGVRVSDEGKIPLLLWTTEDEAVFEVRVTEARNESRQPGNTNNLFWVFALTPEIDDLIRRLFASRQMILNYDQLRSQSKITDFEAPLLSQEKADESKLKRLLNDKLAEALSKGQGLFRGVPKDAASLGKNLEEILKKFYEYAIPSLYPKLEMGSKPMRGTEPEDFLKAANLNSLPPLFYNPPNGLNLVIDEGGKFVPNPSAEIAKEVLDYIRREHSYGNRVTGKTLEDHFQGVGYGWDRDILRLVLAVLLRAGSIEVTHQGRRYRNHQDPQSRIPLTNNPAFRVASFAPRESILLKTLATASQYLEELTGEEVDIEESAIANALKKLADQDLRDLLPIEATSRANDLPVQATLDEYHQSLDTILNSPSDDCVRILAGEGRSFIEARQRFRQIRNALTHTPALQDLQQARTVVNRMWPVISQRTQDASLSGQHAELRLLISSADFYGSLDRLRELSRNLQLIYYRLYKEKHDERTQLCNAATDEVKGQAEFISLDEESARLLLAPLTGKACDNLDLPDFETRCRTCDATLGQIESDITAVPALLTQILNRLPKPEPEPESNGFQRVKAADFFAVELDSPEAVEDAVNRLKEYLLELIANGSKIVIE